MIRRLLAAGAAFGAIAGQEVAAAPAASAGNPHKAAKDGCYNIPQNDPAYSPKLDHDGDGIACES